MIGRFKPVTGVMEAGIGQFTLPGNNAGFCAAILRKSGTQTPLRLESLTYVRPDRREAAPQPSQQPIVVNLLMQLRAYYDQSNTYLRNQATLNIQLTNQLRQVLALSSGPVRSQAGAIQRAVQRNLYRNGEFQRAVDNLARELKKNGNRPERLNAGFPDTVPDTGRNIPAQQAYKAVEKRRQGIPSAVGTPVVSAGQPMLPVLTQRIAEAGMPNSSDQGKQAVIQSKISPSPQERDTHSRSNKNTASNEGEKRRVGRKKPGKKAAGGPVEQIPPEPVPGGKKVAGSARSDQALPAAPAKRGTRQIAQNAGIVSVAPEVKMGPEAAGKRIFNNLPPMLQRRYSPAATRPMITATGREPPIRHPLQISTGTPFTSIPNITLAAFLNRAQTSSLSSKPYFFPAVQQETAGSGRLWGGYSPLPSRTVIFKAQYRPEEQNLPTGGAILRLAERRSNESEHSIPRRHTAADRRSFSQPAGTSVAGDVSSGEGKGTSAGVTIIPDRAIFPLRPELLSHALKNTGWIRPTTTEVPWRQPLDARKPVAARRPWNTGAASDIFRSEGISGLHLTHQREFPQAIFPVSAAPFGSAALTMPNRPGRSPGILQRQPALPRVSVWSAAPETQQKIFSGVLTQVLPVGSGRAAGFRQSGSRAPSGIPPVSAAPDSALKGRSPVIFPRWTAVPVTGPDGTTPAYMLSHHHLIDQSRRGIAPVRVRSARRTDHPNDASGGDIPKTVRGVFPGDRRPAEVSPIFRSAFAVGLPDHVDGGGHQTGRTAAAPHLMPTSGVGSRFIQMQSAVRSVLGGKNMQHQETVRRSRQVSAAVAALEPQKVVALQRQMPSTFRQMSNGSTTAALWDPASHSGAGGTIKLHTFHPGGQLSVPLDSHLPIQPQSRRRQPSQRVFPPGMIYRRPEHRSDSSAQRETGADSGEAVLQAQTVSPARVAAMNAAYSYPPSGPERGRNPAVQSPEVLTREQEERITQRVLEDINYNRMASEVLDRVERRLRAERRKFGR